MCQNNPLLPAIINPRVFESDGFGKNDNILAAFTVFCLMKITERLICLFSHISIFVKVVPSLTIRGQLLNSNVIPSA